MIITIVITTGITILIIAIISITTTTLFIFPYVIAIFLSSAIPPISTIVGITPVLLLKLLFWNGLV